MERLIVIFILVGFTWLLYLLFGSNRWERKKIPAGMEIFCQNPKQRYLLYALGILTFLFVAGVAALCYVMGGIEEAGIWIYLCMVLGVLILLICFLGGYIMYSSHIFFDDEKLIIGRPFRTPLQLSWHEIGEMRIKNRQSFVLFDRNGKVCVKAYINMVNYDIFFEIAQKHCLPFFSESQQLERGAKEKALKYGGEYYVLAVMGFLIFLMDLFICYSSGENIDSILTNSEIDLFPKFFPFVCGIGSVCLVVYCYFRKVVYSSYEIQIHYLLKRNVTLYWKDITSVKLCTKGYGVKKRYILYLQTVSRKYTLRSSGMRSGWDEFLPLLAQVCRERQIPLTRF